MGRGGGIGVGGNGGWGREKGGILQFPFSYEQTQSSRLFCFRVLIVFYFQRIPISEYFAISMSTIQALQIILSSCMHDTNKLHNT